jgi:hypothetical protein
MEKKPYDGKIDFAALELPIGRPPEPGSIRALTAELATARAELTKANERAVLNAQECATARAEAERQYEENVSQIANYAALEAELDAARRQIEGMQRATNEE